MFCFWSLAQHLPRQCPEQPNGQIQDLKTLSLEELLQIDVTTVSREPERRIDAPAAVSVITGEDIRRYGVDTLADALRLADSVSVARFNGGSWAIATRGFSAVTNNKLLVMIDGRSIYTQLFGGVFWEAQHVLLPDLDRIEIIRGPAGTLVGTERGQWRHQHHHETRRRIRRACSCAPLPARASGHISLRATADRSTRARVIAFYAVGSEFDSPELQDGTSAREDRRLRQAGGRIDWDLAGQARLSVHGDLNSGRMGLADRSDIEMDGGNIVVTYTKPLDAGESFQIVGYADREHREVPRQSWETATTYNVEGQHTHPVGAQVSPDVGWRRPLDAQPHETDGADFFEPDDRTIHQVHGFAQTEITLTPQLSATARRARRADDVQRLRAAACGSREVHPASTTRWSGAPSRARCARRPASTRTCACCSTTSSIIRGDRDFKPEQLTAYESGARFNPRANVSMEASVFYNEYDDLRSQEATPLITWRICTTATRPASSLRETCSRTRDGSCTPVTRDSACP